MSHNTYLHHWNTLVHFGVTMLYNSVDLPVDTKFVFIFIAPLQSVGLKYPIIRKYTSSNFPFVHEIYGHADPTTDQCVSKFLRGVRNLQTKASRSPLPITKPILHSRRHPFLQFHDTQSDHVQGYLSGPCLNIKTVLSKYGDVHVKDKTAVRTSYL